MRRAVIRLVVVLFCTLTAAYAFLSASPFSYQEFVRPRMFGTGVFSRWHVVAYWVCLLLAVVDLTAASSGRRLPRRGTMAFAAVWTAVGAYLTVHPVLPTLTDDHRSLAVGMAALVPLIWLAAIDHWAATSWLVRQQPVPPVDRLAIDGRWFVAATGSGLLTIALYAVPLPLAMRGQFEPDLQTRGLVIGLVWTLAEYTGIACAAFLVLAVVIRVCRRAGFGVQYACVFALLTVLASCLVQRAVCDTLGLAGAWSAAVSASCALAIVATWGAFRLRRWSDRNAALTSPFDAFFSPPADAPLDARDLLPFLLIGGSAWALWAVSRTIDWDFLLLKTSVVVLWILAFDRLAGVTPPIQVPDWVIAVVCAAPIAAYVTAPWVDARIDSVELPLRHVLDRYIVYNPSFRLVDGALRRPTRDTFNRFVRENSGLPSSATAEPPDQNFVAALAPVAHQPPPSIFVFIIDSLRPDYLSAYNPAVAFTPRIASFAAESVVFRNTFTRYGGTGLALPSIWMGAAGVHKQYVKPFAPTNTLEKLIIANDYHRVMSVDVIMEQLLLPWPRSTELDRGVRTMDYQFCRTLDELERAVPAIDDGRPLFGYSLPQDLHISNIMTASVPVGESYPGFHAPYAARVHQIDRCFGTFVDFLKRRNLYDHSTIVLTADHGEMLGEEGRWGHVYYLFPQVLKVPLIVHLPAAGSVEVPPDLDAIRFSTDIAPTLYEVLGYRPSPANPLMGRSLLDKDEVASSARRRGVYVVAASYAPVYGVVRRNGRRLYIVDAVTGNDYAYDRAPSGAWKPLAVSDGMRAINQRVIREHIDTIRRVYHMNPSH